LTGDPTLSRTSEYWDIHAGQGDENRAEWFAHPAVAERLLQVRDGKPLERWFIDQYAAGRPLARALSIGCGVGLFELGLIRLGAIEHYDLYDVSPVALETALASARAFGVEDRIAIHQADINHVSLQHVSLQKEDYDLVTFISSLHHVADLEQVLRRVLTALKPDGLIFAGEYTGPDRFAYPKPDAAYAKRLYRALDPALKCPWPELPQPVPEDVIAADPTESIHSSEIIATVQRVFGNIELTPYGYTLTFILWWGLNHDALYETEQGREFVTTLLDLDRGPVISGALPNYFHYALGSKTAHEAGGYGAVDPLETVTNALADAVDVPATENTRSPVC